MGKRKSPPARTFEERENQLINLAVNEAEKRLQNGTASSQIITTLLKLATTRAKLELERLRSDISLSEAKMKEIEDRGTESERYENALKAFKMYKGDYEEEEEWDNEG